MLLGMQGIYQYLPHGRRVPLSANTFRVERDGNHVLPAASITHRLDAADECLLVEIGNEAITVTLVLVVAASPCGGRSLEVARRSA